MTKSRRTNIRLKHFSSCFHSFSISIRLHESTHLITYPRTMRYIQSKLFSFFFFFSFFFYSTQTNYPQTFVIHLSRVKNPSLILLVILLLLLLFICSFWRICSTCRIYSYHFIVSTGHILKSSWLLSICVTFACLNARWNFVQWSIFDGDWNILFQWIGCLMVGFFVEKMSDIVFTTYSNVLTQKHCMKN